MPGKKCFGGVQKIGCGQTNMKTSKTILFVSKVEGWTKNSQATDILDGNPNLHWTQIANFHNCPLLLKPDKGLPVMRTCSVCKNVDSFMTSKMRIHEKMWTHEKAQSHKNMDSLPHCETHHFTPFLPRNIKIEPKLLF